MVHKCIEEDEKFSIGEAHLKEIWDRKKIKFDEMF